MHFLWSVPGSISCEGSCSFTAELRIQNMGTDVLVSYSACWVLRYVANIKHTNVCCLLPRRAQLRFEHLAEHASSGHILRCQLTLPVDETTQRADDDSWCCYDGGAARYHVHMCDATPK